MILSYNLYRKMQDIQTTNLLPKCIVCHHTFNNQINKTRNTDSLCYKCFRALDKPQLKTAIKQFNQQKQLKLKFGQKIKQLIKKKCKKRSKNKSTLPISGKKIKDQQAQMENQIFKRLKTPSTQEEEIDFLYYYSFLENMLND